MLELIMRSGYDYSWFVLNKRIIDKEFVLSGSEQNPELTRKDIPGYLLSRLTNSTPLPTEAFIDHGPDFVTADGALPELVAGMNRLTGSDLINVDDLHAQISLRDEQVDNPNSTDPQIIGIRNSLAYIGDALVRTTPLASNPRPRSGSPIAIRMNILTRKTLGGLQTDLSGPRPRRHRQSHHRALRRGRGRGLRWRRCPRLPRAGRHLSRRLPVLRQANRPCRRPGKRVIRVC